MRKHKVKYRARVRARNILRARAQRARARILRDRAKKHIARARATRARAVRARAQMREIAPLIFTPFCNLQRHMK